MLLYTMSRKAQEILWSLNATDAELENFETVKAKLQAHFVHTKNVVYESTHFNRHKQEAGETVDEFATAPLHKLAGQCEFSDLKERLVRDRFVVGLLDQSLSEALQLNWQRQF